MNFIVCLWAKAQRLVRKPLMNRKGGSEPTATAHGQLQGVLED